MDRRLFLAAGTAWPATALRAQEATARPRHKISAAELHEALSARFPLRVEAGGLFELQVSAPSLHLRPARNQLGAGLLVQAGGPALQPLPPGEFDVVFSLRYERTDRTLRAHSPEVLDVRWPGLPPEAAQAFRGMLPALAQEALGELTLHRFSDRELALADTMGFEPDKLVVVDGGLLVVFGPKRPSPPPPAR